MIVHRDLQRLPAFKHAILTIGSFDGVHIGHQEIIRKMKTLASKIGGETVIITFDPHPRITLKKDADRLKLLTGLDEKVTLLEKYGVDHLIVTPFTKTFSTQSPEAYIRDFLVEHIRPKLIVIGYDHRFGYNRSGNIDTLRFFSSQYDYEVLEISKQSVESITISSTRIRDALLTGHVDLACNWLGHAYPLSGKVIHGQKLGSGLGFPTANIQVLSLAKLIPADGIYAVSLVIENVKKKGMLYIGSRRTVAPDQDRSIEVNIFDFEKNIYGKFIRLFIHSFIRKDEVFISMEALSEQLKQDRQNTLDYFDRIKNADISL